MEMLIRGVLLTFWLVLSFSAQAHNPPSPATSGYSWLQAQQTADGEVQSPQDSASPLQGTYETVLAFSNSEQLDLLDRNALTSYLDQQAPSQTEHFAKLLTLKLKLGLPVGDLEARLLEAQNQDGGFGDSPGYDSTVYDTVFALQALALTRYKNTPVAGRAIAYLLEQQQQDSGFGINSTAPSSLYITSLALRALQPYLYTFNVGQAMTEARDYLLAHTETGSSWPSDWEAAEFLLAVIPVTTDAGLYKSSLNWLRIQQFENGSWQGDVFATALALQALHLAENISFPTAPDTATLKGRVIDRANGQPLHGVQVALSSAAVSVVTDPDGNFQITGLQPDAYTILYSAQGYLSAQQELTTRAGQLIDLGSITLQVAPTTALVTGTVTDAGEGAPLANALVEIVAGVEQVQVVTGLNGTYSIVVPAGDLAIRVTAQGYRTVAASANVAAGSSVKFSPALYKESDEPLPLELIGRVIDIDGRAALAGVRVMHVGSGTSVTTGGDGFFSLTGLNAGEQQFQISLEGYQGLTMAVVLPEYGRLDTGVIQLAREELQAATSVHGRVLDADTGLGIAGASVAVDGLATTADSDGWYSINGISALEFTLGANATGYSYSATPVTLAQHRALQLDLELMRAEVSGISIDTVLTDKVDYAAYERVSLQAILSNKTVRERRVRLYVLISDTQGNVIDRFAATDLPLPSEHDTPEAQAHYEQHLEEALVVLAPSETRQVALEMGWNTGRQLPGQYRVTVQALDGSTSHLIAESAALFRVEPTQRLSSAMLEASPAYALMDSSPDLGFTLTLRNASNQPVQTGFSYVLRTPSGTLLQQGDISVDINPDETTKEVAIAAEAHTFVESGNYLLELSVAHGTVPDAVINGVIFVPPTVRLTVEQDLAPERLIPGSAREVQVQIQIKGVDGE